MGANLKEVRERISSVISTQQITKAMKMVSAAKLRRAQDAIVQLRPYAAKLNEILVHILSDLEGDASMVYGKHRQVNKVVIVVVTSSRGLCGAFNSNIIKQALHLANTKYKKQFKAGNVTFLCIGKRGYDYFRKRYPADQVNRDYVLLFQDLTFEGIIHVPDMIMEGFSQEEFDAVEICYGRFKNAAMQYAESIQYLPIPTIKEPEEGKQRRADYIFEPDKQNLLKELVPSILQTKFHSTLLDTHASEHGARMTAMDSATENADDLLRELRIAYNKARQEAITREISEIVGGAAALSG